MKKNVELNILYINQPADMCFQLRLTSKRDREDFVHKRSTYNFYNNFNALYNGVNEFLSLFLEKYIKKTQIISFVQSRMSLKFTHK